MLTDEQVDYLQSLVSDGILLSHEENASLLSDREALLKAMSELKRDVLEPDGWADWKARAEYLEQRVRELGLKVGKHFGRVTILREQAERLAEALEGLITSSPLQNVKPGHEWDHLAENGRRARAALQAYREQKEKA